ncbi:unnamed protein product, partial [marine sediment metagenome]
KVLDGVYPGKPIRYPVADKGRFVPLEKGTYLESLLGRKSIDVGDETISPEPK